MPSCRRARALMVLLLLALVVAAAGTTSATAATGPLSPAPGSPVATGRGPSAIATGDFDANGRTDLVVVNAGDANGTILLGGEAGRFRRAAGGPVRVGADPQRVAVADFNRDGRDDLAVTNRDSDDVAVLLGDGRGGFRRSALLTTNIPMVFAFGDPVGIGAADLDSDRIPDLAVTVVGPGSRGEVETFRGSGNGSFAPAALANDRDRGAGSGQDLALADLDGNGHPDVVLAGGFSAPNRIETLLGSGAGAFSYGSTAVVGQRPDTLAVGDLNRDRHQDVAVTNTDDGTVSILLGNGRGALTRAGPPVPAGTKPTGLVEGDFDGDGRIDLAVANADAGTVTLLLGNGQGGFRPTPGRPVGGDPQALVTGDFDGDGSFDLAVGNVTDNRVAILIHPQPREVTLRRTGRGFAGAFSSPAANCERNQRVAVVRVRPGRALTVGRTRTDRFGRFALAARAGPGRFRATVAQTPGCRAATSRALTLR